MNCIHIDVNTHFTVKPQKIVDSNNKSAICYRTLIPIQSLATVGMSTV